MTEEQPKTLDDWVLAVKESKKNWLVFYEETLGTRVSSIPRFYRAINLYGLFPMFEAVVDSATRDLNGDPLNYVLKVCANKWREEQEARNEQTDYADALEQSKKASQQANKDLARRISKRKGVRK